MVLKFKTSRFFIRLCLTFLLLLFRAKPLCTILVISLSTSFTFTLLTMGTFAELSNV